MSNTTRSGHVKAHLVDAISSEFGSEDVRRAQLQSALSNITVTLIANSFIASSAALLIYDERGTSFIFVWLAGIFGLNAVRLAHGLRLLRADASHQDPEKALKSLTRLAFVAGLCWSPLPIAFLDSIDSRTAAYIVFIMAGITTGSIIQSLAYWRISVAFSSPILAATIAKLLLQQNTVDLVVATNMALLMAMLIRSAVISQQKFCVSHAATRQATELATSLRLAHAEVQEANETLKRLATTDPLTGLPNRSVFNQTLASLIHEQTPVSLALIDIDNLKTVNDTMGHAAGDEILCTLALFMMDKAGDDITPIRLGGDEFAVIASGSDSAARLMDYVLMLQQNMKDQSGGLHNVTLSVGLCPQDGKQRSASELFAATDRALYAAKSAGRDCIRSA